MSDREEVENRFARRIANYETMVPENSELNEQDSWEYCELVEKAIYGLCGGDLSQAIGLLDSKYSIDCLRPFLAELFESPNVLGKSLVYKKNEGYTKNQNTPLDDFVKHIREHRRFWVFRNARISGMTYERALIHAADALNISEEQIKYAAKLGKNGRFGVPYPSSSEVKEAKKRREALAKLEGQNAAKDLGGN